MRIFLLLALLVTQRPSVPIKPILATEPVGTDADDPAIWVNPKNPSESLILGTDKTEAPNGGLYVFDLQGKIVQKIGSLDRPNNVDVEYGFAFNGKTVDIAVLTERKQHRLRIFAIDPETRRLTDISGETTVLKNESGEASEPMGIGLYKSPAGDVDAIVSPKTGSQTAYLAQYRLVARNGKVDVEEIRRFGEFSGEGEIESILVDDELGFVYCSDEGAGIRKYHASPSKDSAQVAFFGKTGYEGDREGLALFATGKGQGYLLSTDQIDGGSLTHVYRREGDNQPLLRLTGGSDATDGIEATSLNLGGPFGEGILITMNSRDRNYHVFTGTSIKRALQSR